MNSQVKIVLSPSPWPLVRTRVIEQAIPPPGPMYKPYFSASSGYVNGTNTINPGQSGQIVFQTSKIQGTTYQPSTGNYSITVPGGYSFKISLQISSRTLNNIPEAFSLSLLVNGVQIWQRDFQFKYSNGTLVIDSSFDLDYLGEFNSGDQISCSISNNGQGIIQLIPDKCIFFGSKIA